MVTVAAIVVAWHAVLLMVAVVNIMKKHPETFFCLILFLASIIMLHSVATTNLPMIGAIMCVLGTVRILEGRKKSKLSGVAIGAVFFMFGIYIIY